jgi:hypothetical protein
MASRVKGNVGKPGLSISNHPSGSQAAAFWSIILAFDVARKNTTERDLVASKERLSIYHLLGTLIHWKSAIVANEVCCIPAQDRYICLQQGQMLSRLGYSQSFKTLEENSGCILR